MLNRARTAGLALFALSMVGAGACSSGGGVRAAGSGDPATDAANILARYKSTPAADAQLALRIKPAKGDTLNFQLHLWCAADGRVRLIASKLDVDFCSALLKPDGSYIVVAPRAHLAAVGIFDDEDRANLSPLFTQPALISDELRSGPLPAKGPWRGGSLTPLPCSRSDTLLTLSTTSAAITTFVIWDAVTGLVTSKNLGTPFVDPAFNQTTDQDRSILEIAYSHERDFDGLLRPTLATVTVASFVGTTPGTPAPKADAATITIGLRKFEGVPSISDGRMRLDVPADAKTVPLDELLKHLGD